MGCHKPHIACAHYMHVQVELAAVGRFLTLARAGWVGAKHERGGKAWPRGVRARVPLVLASGGDGQLSYTELMYSSAVEL